MVLNKYVYLFCLYLCFTINVQSQVIDTVMVNENGVFYSVDSVPGSSYFWAVEDGEISAGQGTSGVLINWKNSIGRKKLKVVEVNAGQCISDTVFAYIIVKDELRAFVPSAFTPNGDGLNDEFIPYFDNEKILNYRFIVINRWGTIVYESNNPKEGWNGTFEGIECISGIYSWEIVASLTKAKVHYFRGTVTIMR
jgi:gliding motility-associated-like protein